MGTPADAKVRLYELVLENGRSASPYVWRIRYALAHKGVPFEYHLGETYEKDFLYPRVTRTATVEGQTHEYQGYDTERMRLCRGFLNRFVPGRTKECS